MPDEKLIESLYRNAISDNPKIVADYKNNPSAAKKVLRDRVIERYPGTVNPAFVDEVLEKLLE